MKRNMGAALRATVDAQGEADKGRRFSKATTVELDDKVTRAERTLVAMHGASEAGPRPRRPKVVRDTFTMPPAEHVGLGELQSRALALGVVASKSQLVRAGLRLLGNASDKALVAALGAIEAVPTGRPGANG